MAESIRRIRHGRRRPGPQPTRLNRRIAKARAEGQVARSRDLGHLPALGAGWRPLVVLRAAPASWLARQLLSATGCASTPRALADAAGDARRRLAQLALRC